jgi:hypothetical protein
MLLGNGGCDKDDFLTIRLMIRTFIVEVDKK